MAITDHFGQFGAVGASATAVTATLNPSDKATNAVLSNGNLTYTGSGTSDYVTEWVRGTVAITTPTYFEVRVDAYDSASNAQVGVSRQGGSVDESSGGYGLATADGWVYVAGGGKWHALGGGAYGSAWVAGSIIGVAVDPVAGKIWFSLNNVWQASGAPASGTGEAYNGLTGTLLPAVASYRASETLTARFAAASMTYAPPSGFTTFS